MPNCKIDSSSETVAAAVAEMAGWDDGRSAHFAKLLELVAKQRDEARALCSRLFAYAEVADLTGTGSSPTNKEQKRYDDTIKWATTLLAQWAATTDTHGFKEVQTNDHEFARFLRRVNAIDNFHKVGRSNQWYGPDNRVVALCIYSGSLDCKYYIRDGFSLKVPKRMK